MALRTLHCAHIDPIPLLCPDPRLGLSRPECLSQIVPHLLVRRADIRIRERLGHDQALDSVGHEV